MKQILLIPLAALALLISSGLVVADVEFSPLPLAKPPTVNLADCANEKGYDLKNCPLK